MSNVSNSAACFDIYGTNAVLVSGPSTRTRASTAPSVRREQSPTIELMRTSRQVGGAEDRTWAIVALASLTLVVMSVLL